MVPITRSIPDVAVLKRYLPLDVSRRCSVVNRKTRTGRWKSGKAEHTIRFV